MLKYICYCFSIILIFSCNSNYTSLVNYYADNSVLHKEVVDSLLSFYKSKGYKAVIRKNTANNSGDIILNLHYGDDSEGYGVIFDSLNIRSGFPLSASTDIYFPVSAIKNFRKSIYESLSVDEYGVFFGYKYEAVSEYVDGILICENQSKLVQKNIIKQISASAFIYRTIVP